MDKSTVLNLKRTERCLQNIIEKKGHCEHTCGECWFFDLKTRICSLLSADLESKKCHTEKLKRTKKTLNEVWDSIDTFPERVYEWAVREYLRTHTKEDIVEILL